MSKSRAKFIITPETRLGTCPEHPGGVVTLFMTVNESKDGRILRANCCTECIAELKPSLRKRGVKIIDRSGASLN